MRKIITRTLGIVLLILTLQLLCLLNWSGEINLEYLRIQNEKIINEELLSLSNSMTIGDASFLPEVPEVVAISPLETNMKQKSSNYHVSIQFLHQLTKVKTSKNSLFDILSIGSLTQIESLRAQADTWASLSSVGNFFAATENDDPDPNCYKTMTQEEAIERSKYCRRRRFEKSVVPNALQQKFASKFAPPRWLKKKRDPAGWMCAQRRPPFALSKLLRLYRKGYKVQGDTFIPPYLILIDDDTFIDLKILEETIILNASNVSLASIPIHDAPVVFAGCRIRHPIDEVNFTFPYGGYGQFFSRGALIRLIQPLYCNNTSLTGFEQEACERIKNPTAITLGERKYFAPGMSISDLMEVYAASDDACAHSDWLTGYFVNFYNISRHVVDDGVWLNSESRMDNVKEARLYTFDKSEIYRSNKIQSPGHCGVGDFKNCTNNSMICHRLSPEDMKHRNANMTIIRSS